MRRLTNDECYTRLTKAECYTKTVNINDKAKVKKARAGINPTTPASLIGQVAAELGLRAFADEVPEPEPVPPVEPWNSGYPPRAYNQGSRGQNCIFNVKINCVPHGNGYIDKNGLTYSDSGLCDGGRSESPDIPGLKPADMKDQKEPWDSYEWFGITIGPNQENYPAASYDR